MSIIALGADGEQSPPPPVAEPKKLNVKTPFRSYLAKRPAPSAAFNWDLFYRVMNVQSKSKHVERMNAFITTACEQMGAQVVAVDGNLYVQKGEADIYPCVVAHTDTVHEIIDDDAYRVYYEQDLIFAWNIKADKATGIGGDDKVGVFIALELLASLPACKAAFFRDEEIGCQGANEAVMPFFDDCAFVLQADRREHEDFVIHASGEQLSDKAFQDAAKPALDLFGFKPYRNGLPTDVATLKRKGLKVCAVNCSCGYYNPHGAGEYIVAGDVEHTLLLFQSIATEMGSTQWIMTKEAAPQTTYRHQPAQGRFRRASHLHRLRIPLPVERFSFLRDGKEEKTSLAFRAEWDRAHAELVWDAIVAERKIDEQRWSQRYGFGGGLWGDEDWGEYAGWDGRPNLGLGRSRLGRGADAKPNESGIIVVQKNSIKDLLVGGVGGMELYPLLCDACLDKPEHQALCALCLNKIDVAFMEADLNEEKAEQEKRDRLLAGRVNLVPVCGCAGDAGTAIWDQDEAKWFCMECDAYVDKVDYVGNKGD